MTTQNDKPKKKILILVAKEGDNKKAFVKRISDKLKNKAEFTLASISDLYFDIDQKNTYIEINGIPVTNFDLVYIRSAGSNYSILASTLALCLKEKGINYLDKAWAGGKPFGDKFTSLLKLALNGLPIFRTIYLLSHNVSSQKERIAKELGLPLVAKEVSTQRGVGVHKISSIEDFDKLPAVGVNGKENLYLFQEFVNFDTEYRILVLGGNARVWEIKTATVQGEFRHNVSLGATEEFLDINAIPEELKKLAEKSANALDLQVAGVDIAINKSTIGYHLIEVNRGPGFTYDDVNSPEMDEMAKYLLDEAGK